jgi:hypothetical protein
LKFEKTSEKIKTVGVCSTTVGGDSSSGPREFGEAIDYGVDEDFKSRFGNCGKVFLLSGAGNDNAEDVASEVVIHSLVIGIL